MRPHPLVEEDGFLVRSAVDIARPAYLLLSARQFLALHRAPAEQTYTVFAGDPVELVTLDPAGDLVSMALAAGRRVAVPGGWWRGLRLGPGGQFALLGLGPGAAPVEWARRATLVQLHPRHRRRIARFTR